MSNYPLKVTLHCTLSIPLCWIDCVCRSCNHKVFDSTWEQRWLQWEGCEQVGKCGAAPVWLTFSCALRLSITPPLLWLTHRTDSTLWFYGKRMYTHCGAPLIFFFTEYYNMVHNYTYYKKTSSMLLSLLCIPLVKAFFTVWSWFGPWKPK